MAEVDYESALDTVCWLGLDMAAARDMRRQEIYPQAWPNYSNLCVAAYLGDFNLAKQIVQGGCKWTTGCLAVPAPFPTPLDCAALGGHARIIHLFRELRPRRHGDMLETSMQKNGYLPRWSNPIGCLKGAVQSGDVDIVCLAAEPFIASAISEGLALGYYKSYLLEALKYATNWEVYETFRNELRILIPEDERITDDLLRCHTVWGNLDMVQRLVKGYGIHVRHPRGRHDDNLLTNAARFYHEDIVDFLLDHDADPNEGEGTRRGSTLSAAAAAGSLPIVRKLLDHGARVGGKDYDRAIMYSLRREHTAMVELLLDRDNVEPSVQTRNIEGKDIGRPRFVRIIKTEGLESMVELLEKHGMVM